MTSETRIDKYLWAIRMFKTRTLVAEAIDGGKIKMDKSPIKSSKKVKLGEVYTIKRENQTLEIEVVQIIDKRLSASLAQECYKEISNIIKNSNALSPSFFTANIYREKGKGRPTKRERRDIDEMKD